MSERDEHGDGSAPITPADEAAVSRLLAEAGGPVAMPAAVEARLQAVLDELAAERREAGLERTTVVPLRARRRWPRVLVAAAALMVGGYAIGNAALQGTLSGSDGTTAADSASAGSADTLDSAPREDTPGAGALEDQGAEAAPDQDGVPDAAPRFGRTAATVRIRPEQPDVGVRRALRVLDGRRDLAELDARTNLGTGCRRDGAGADAAEDEGGALLDVRYGGRPAVLAARELAGDLVEVTVFSCSGTELAGMVVDQVGP